MANDILWLFDKSGFTLHAEAPPGGETFSATTLEVAGTAGPGSVKQTLKLKSPIGVPRKLLKAGPANGLVFRNKDELEQLAQEEWAALRERLRRRLAQPFEVSFDNADTLFELQAIASQKVTARRESGGAAGRGGCAARARPAEPAGLRSRLAAL